MIQTFGTQSKNVYALTNIGLYRSIDFGATFTKVTEQMPSGTSWAVRLRVSHVNPDNMIYLWKIKATPADATN